MRDIGIWFVGGVAVAGLVSALLPPEFITNHLGTGIIPMLAALGIGIPLYVCATSSTPVVAALAAKGLSPGAALVFLLTGPVTNAASLAVLAKTLGKRATAIMLTAISVTSLVLGFFANWLYLRLGLSVTDWVHLAPDETTTWWKITAGIVLAALVGAQWAMGLRRK